MGWESNVYKLPEGTAGVKCSVAFDRSWVRLEVLSVSEKNFEPESLYYVRVKRDHRILPTYYRAMRNFLEIIGVPLVLTEELQKQLEDPNYFNWSISGIQKMWTLVECQAVKDSNMNSKEP